jgi:hypothetical protein
MIDYVDPSTLQGHPLILKRIGENDYSVRVLGRKAGRITLQQVTGGHKWLWTITGTYLPEEMRPGHGHVDSFEEAKAAFRKRYELWLQWAVGLGHNVVWYGDYVPPKPIHPA